jgi:D-lactate dehydrogenase
MKIAIYETKDWESEHIRQKLLGQELFFYQQALNPRNLSSTDAEILVPFVGCELSAAVLKHFGKLKFIATKSTGFDHIDLAFCRQKEIPVSNVPTYGENTVAEFAFALMLALSRKLYPALKRVKEEGDFSYEDLTGFDLKGKTLGVVGTGHIGVHVIRIAFGFDMKILAFDPHPNQQLVKDFGVRFLDLPELLKNSDIVTLHVPYLPATHHLINRDNVKLFKPGSWLINTARGGLVETSALLQALGSGQMAGAGLDVLEEEGFVKDEMSLLNSGHPSREELKTVLADHELMRMKNVLITPHNAFNTKEAVERILDTTIANIESFIKGEPMNLVKL